MPRIWPTEDDEADRKKLRKSKLSGGTTRHKGISALKRKHHEIEEESDMEETSSKNKSRPQVLKSNVPVSRLGLRDVSGIEKAAEHIDPRFMEYAGEVNLANHRQNYSFINEIRQAEIVDLKKSLRKTKDVEKARDIKDQINRRNVALRTFDKQEKMETLKTDYFKKQSELAEQGVKPKFLNKRTTKMLGAADEFLGMGEGRVQYLLTQKRTRKAQKDKKYMPTRQAGAD